VPIRIGTSGWHYKHWIGPFYPPKTPASKMLEFYARHFDTVELNNTFYKLPGEAALELWRSGTPANFRFALKGSRFLTHMKKLTDTGRGIGRFFDRAKLLGRKLGPIVFQLPPNFRINPERLEHFLEALPSGHRYAFEFRDPSWNDARIYALLRRHKSAYCIFDLAGFQSPLEITADFTYIRLHGPGGKYQGSYSDASLRAWRRRLREWNLRASYVYFDNDQSGYAAQNALRLKEFLSG
jgi:uncharacterized protein YecE (DUF72 family)